LKSDAGSRLIGTLLGKLEPVETSVLWKLLKTTPPELVDCVWPLRWFSMDHRVPVDGISEENDQLRQTQENWEDEIRQGEVKESKQPARECCGAYVVDSELVVIHNNWTNYL
jgi:hypothetical protein